MKLPDAFSEHWQRRVYLGVMAKEHARKFKYAGLERIIKYINRYRPGYWKYIAIEMQKPLLHLYTAKHILITKDELILEDVSRFLNLNACVAFSSFKLTGVLPWEVFKVETDVEKEIYIQALDRAILSLEEYLFSLTSAICEHEASPI